MLNDTGKKLRIEELKLNMEVSAEQLSDIHDTYMIIKFNNIGDNIGNLVYIGENQTSDYDKWFMQSKPITPIYNSTDELEDMSVYDE
jgi:hypothetical protein